MQKQRATVIAVAALGAVVTLGWVRQPGPIPVPVNQVDASDRVVFQPAVDLPRIDGPALPEKTFAVRDSVFRPVPPAASKSRARIMARAEASPKAAPAPRIVEPETQSRIPEPAIQQHRPEPEIQHRSPEPPAPASIPRAEPEPEEQQSGALSDNAERVQQEEYDYRQSRSPRIANNGRSRGKSAVIIAGGAATGAAIGGLAGGGKGAAIGALGGGIAGLIYDRVTRNR